MSQRDGIKKQMELQRELDARRNGTFVPKPVAKPVVHPAKPAAPAAPATTAIVVVEKK